jgi:hypothetical protein
MRAITHPIISRRARFSTQTQFAMQTQLSTIPLLLFEESVEGSQCFYAT